MKTVKKINLTITLIFVGFVFTACEKNEDLDSLESLTESQNIESEQEIVDYSKYEYYPVNDKAKVVTKKFYGSDIEFYQEGDSFILGDMIFTEKSLEATNSEEAQKGVMRKTSRWGKDSRGLYLVPYTIDPNLSQTNKNRISTAITNFSRKTKIRFVRRTNQKDYVHFKKGTGCSSFVGRIGGKQNITLELGCSTGVTIHEMAHAIGMVHEHQHYLRNNYVKILWDNIKKDKVNNNFPVYSYNSTNTTSFDFSSIMLYGSYIFSKNGKPTMTKRNGQTFTAQRKGLSFGDEKTIDRIYK